MDEMKQAWDDVGEGFSELGKMISDRYRNTGEEQPEQAPEADQNAVGDAIRRATEELDRAFTSLGDTLRDEESRKQMWDTGKKLTDALKVTFTEVADEIRRTVGASRPGGSDGPPPGPDEPPATGTQA